jgi:DNA-3-methyladenine glycosylase
MTLKDCLPVSFYHREAVVVARELLGMRLVRRFNGQRLAGYIIETEAYSGEEDQACHARGGCTPRTVVMYGPPGHAYVYFTYGMHWCLNCVTGAEGYPAAVLIRAIYPSEGLDRIAVHRHPRSQQDWTNGPGKLTKALAIDNQFNGLDLCDPGGDLWIEAGHWVPDGEVIIGPRVGINRVVEPWRSIPWRFLTQDNHWEDV